MKRLVVHLHGGAVGTLTQDASGLLGSGNPTCARRPGTMPCSSGWLASSRRETGAASLLQSLA
jgi:hypothetical protein